MLAPPPLCGQLSHFLPLISQFKATKGRRIELISSFYFTLFSRRRGTSCCSSVRPSGPPGSATPSPITSWKTTRWLPRSSKSSGKPNRLASVVVAAASRCPPAQTRCRPPADVSGQGGLRVQRTAALPEPGSEGSKPAQGGSGASVQLREADLRQAGCGGDPRSLTPPTKICPQPPPLSLMLLILGAQESCC